MTTGITKIMAPHVVNLKSSGKTHKIEGFTKEQILACCNVLLETKKRFPNGAGNNKYHVRASKMLAYKLWLLSTDLYLNRRLISTINSRGQRSAVDGDKDIMQDIRTSYAINTLSPGGNCHEHGHYAAFLALQEDALEGLYINMFYESWDHRYVVITTRPIIKRRKTALKNISHEDLFQDWQAVKKGIVIDPWVATPQIITFEDSCWYETAIRDNLKKSAGWVKICEENRDWTVRLSVNEKNTLASIKRTINDKFTEWKTQIDKLVNSTKIKADDKKRKTMSGREYIDSRVSKTVVKDLYNNIEEAEFAWEQNWLIKEGLNNVLTAKRDQSQISNHHICTLPIKHIYGTEKFSDRKPSVKAVMDCLSKRSNGIVFYSNTTLGEKDNEIYVYDIGEKNNKQFWIDHVKRCSTYVFGRMAKA
jgi:hypothetical protein